jgi:hypothetical protein
MATVLADGFAQEHVAKAAMAYARNFLQRCRDWLWGYDFFISYHWDSGGVYAVKLAQHLRDSGFDVFLDRADYASGDDWTKIGTIALRNTQRLVLVLKQAKLYWISTLIS